MLRKRVTLLYSSVITITVIIMEQNRLTRQDLQELARKPVTTTAELAQMFELSHGNAAKLAYDLRRRGFLVLVSKGLYASVPLDVDPNGFRPDPFFVVQKVMGQNFAFSHFSALTLLGFEQTIRKTIHVTIPGVRSRRRKVGEIVVHVHHSGKRDWDSSTTVSRRGGELLRVTTPERTMIDLASLPNSLQDYEEDLEAFRDLLPRADPKKMRLMILGNPRVTALARTGHLLSIVDQENGRFSKTLLDIQESVSRMSPIYFATKPYDIRNRLDTRFKVIYPGRA